MTNVGSIEVKVTPVIDDNAVIDALVERIAQRVADIIHSKPLVIQADGNGRG